VLVKGLTWQASMLYKTHLEQTKIKYLRALLKQTKGDVTKAAMIAGLYRTYLYTLLKRYEIAFQNPKAKGICHSVRGHERSVTAILQVWK
jgi:DNA-binding NtrC family response regulator